MLVGRPHYLSSPPFSPSPSPLSTGKLVRDISDQVSASDLWQRLLAGGRVSQVFHRRLHGYSAEIGTLPGLCRRDSRLLTTHPVSPLPGFGVVRGRSLSSVFSLLSPGKRRRVGSFQLDPSQSARLDEWHGDLSRPCPHAERCHHIVRGLPHRPIAPGAEAVVGKGAAIDQIGLSVRVGRARGGHAQMDGRQIVERQPSVRKLPHIS